MSKERIDLNGKNILVTGSPGFIGANLVLRLLKEMNSGTVVSLDNMNDYYDPSLKEYRLSIIKNAALTSPVRHVFVKGNIADKTLIDKLFAEYKFDVVVNLAAQAGVRYSIDHPDVYIESNIIGFYNILEACRNNPVEHLVYASSSSVYGGNKKVPFSTEDKVDNPVSLYAATKKSNELIAHVIISRVMDWIHEKITTTWETIKAVVTIVLEGIRTFFETIWNAISTTVSTVMDTISNVISTVWNAISGYISGILNAIWSVISSIWESIKNHITNTLNAIHTVVSAVWNAISGFISSVLSTIRNTVSNIWNGIKNTVSTVMNAIKNTVSSIWDSVKSAVSQKITAIKDTIVNGFNAAVNFIKNLGSQAFQWGADIINGIVDGIKSCISKVSDAVKGVANKIKSFLHFSVPDEGPLADFESWMPDFMQGLADGKLLQKQPPKNYLTKKPDERVPYESNYLENDHEAIVDRKTWDTVQEIIRQKKAVTAAVGRIGGRPHFLYGKLYCGECGEPMTRRTLNGPKGIKHKVWTCRGRHEGRKGNGCKLRTIKEDLLLQTIEESIGCEVNSENAAQIQRVVITEDDIAVETS